MKNKSRNLFLLGISTAIIALNKNNRGVGVRAPPLKIKYIYSERIRSEYNEFSNAEEKLQHFYSKVQNILNKKSMNLDKLIRDYETQRLMSGPKWREEKEEEIQNLEKEIQKFQETWSGPQGVLYRMQAKLELEILNDLKRVITNYCSNNKINYCFNANTTILYGIPTDDITKEILNGLKDKKNKKNNRLKKELDQLEKSLNEL